MELKSVEMKRQVINQFTENKNHILETKGQVKKEQENEPGF